MPQLTPITNNREWIETLQFIDFYKKPTAFLPLTRLLFHHPYQLVALMKALQKAGMNDEALCDVIADFYFANRHVSIETIEAFRGLLSEVESFRDLYQLAANSVASQALNTVPVPDTEGYYVNLFAQKINNDSPLFVYPPLAPKLLHFYDLKPQWSLYLNLFSTNLLKQIAFCTKESEERQELISCTIDLLHTKQLSLQDLFVIISYIYERDLRKQLLQHIAEYYQAHLTDFKQQVITYPAALHLLPYLPAWAIHSVAPNNVWPQIYQNLLSRQTFNGMFELQQLLALFLCLKQYGVADDTLAVLQKQLFDRTLDLASSSAIEMKWAGNTAEMSALRENFIACGLVPFVFDYFNAKLSELLSAPRRSYRAYHTEWLSSEDARSSLHTLYPLLPRTSYPLNIDEANALYLQQDARRMPFDRAVARIEQTFREYYAVQLANGSLHTVEPFVMQALTAFYYMTTDKMLFDALCSYLNNHAEQYPFVQNWRTYRPWCAVDLQETLMLKGNTFALTDYIQNAGQSVTFRCQHIMQAVRLGHSQVIHVLLESGHPKDFINEALVVACRHGHLRIAEKLLSESGQHRPDVKTVTAAFESAAKQQHTEILELLLSLPRERQPRPKAVACAYCTAVETQQEGIVSVILQHARHDNRPPLALVKDTLVFAIETQRGSMLEAIASTYRPREDCQDLLNAVLLAAHADAKWHVVRKILSLRPIEKFDRRILESVFSKAALSGQTSVAVRLLNYKAGKMIPPSIYRAVLQACADARQWPEVLWLLQSAHALNWQACDLQALSQQASTQGGAAVTDYLVSMDLVQRDENTPLTFSGLSKSMGVLSDRRKRERDSAREDDLNDVFDCMDRLCLSAVPSHS